jgi:hypothetical protein
MTAFPAEQEITRQKKAGVQGPIVLRLFQHRLDSLVTEVFFGQLFP